MFIAYFGMGRLKGTMRIGTIPGTGNRPSLYRNLLQELAEVEVIIILDHGILFKLSRVRKIVELRECLG
jgi:hypothetical protein